MRAWVFAVVLGASALAAADGTDELNGKLHFQAGERYYLAQQYAKALAEFTAGYELTRRAPFLLNIAQTYRALHELRKSRDFYRMFVEQAPESPLVPNVEKILEELDQLLASHKREPAAPPTTPAPESAPVVPAPPPAALPATPPPLAPPPAAAPPTPAIAVAPSPVLATPTLLGERAPPARRPFIRRHWWIVPAAAVVLAGVGVGVYFAVRPHAVGCRDAENGCLDLTH